MNLTCLGLLLCAQGVLAMSISKLLLGHQQVDVRELAGEWLDSTEASIRSATYAARKATMSTSFPFTVKRSRLPSEELC